jgi:hypothetical protein
MNKKMIITLSVIVTLISVLLLYVFVFSKDIKDKIILPYIVHQKGMVDPHVASAVPLADQLDEVLFEGLFNISANSSGVTYEDGLGELIGIDANSIVTVKLKQNRKWHSSFTAIMDKDRVSVQHNKDIVFEAQDLQFTLERIRKFGSLSPDYVLVSQAVPDFAFAGPDENNDIRFQFKGDRIWSQSDIKEVLSFKILPAGSTMDGGNYNNGTGPFLEAGEYENVKYLHKNPSMDASISQILLKPYIDNSTYITELKNRNINALLGTPFGEIAPILHDSTRYFYKSTIATTFFALLFNTERLNIDQRKSLRALIDNHEVMERFFKVGTKQQRQIANYKGDNNNYEDYLNHSLFPATSYYVNEGVVVPETDNSSFDTSILPDTIHIQTCINYQYREELSELVDIMNDPAICGGKLKVTAVTNEEIAKGNYDAILVPVCGYRSNFLFDLYSIFLREPDFSTNRISLVTTVDKRGKLTADLASFTSNKNFLRIDLSGDVTQKDDLSTFLYSMYEFMSTSEIGDKQAYAMMVDQQESQLALGKWLFSLPSLAYFNTQFDSETIDLYGTASQLSTIEKWKERKR